MGTLPIFGMVMNKQCEQLFLVPLKRIACAALTLVATFMTLPLYALSDSDSSIAPGPGEISQSTLAELEPGTFPASADARIKSVWTRQGTGSPDNLARIAAIPKVQERFVSGCSE
jgi:hypothetical protein